MRDTFIFYKSFHESASGMLTDEQYGRLFRAVCDYAFYEADPALDMPERALFVLIKPLLDANKKHQENGKKGGAPKGNQNAKKKTKTTEKQAGLISENKAACSKKTSNINKNINTNTNTNINMNDNISGAADAENNIHNNDGEKKIVKITCKNGNVIDVDLNGDRISQMVSVAMSGKSWDEILKEAE